MSHTYRLSKSKIMSGVQCHRRLWLETHRRELAVVTPETQHIFRMGHLLGNKARELMGPGELVEHERDIGRALEETPTALSTARARGTTVFEPAFAHDDVVSRADGFAPTPGGWHMIEIKAATSAKDYFLLDCAVQSWVIEGAGYQLERITLGYLDNQFVYQGGGAYTGLLSQDDVTERVRSLIPDVAGIIAAQRAMLAEGEPAIQTGEQCTTPYACPFFAHCRSQEPVAAEFPIEVFPYHTARRLHEAGYVNALDVPETELESARDLRILRSSRTGTAYIEPAAQQFLAAQSYPRYYLDFETVSTPVPVWRGTRPYQQIAFQWSCHIESAPGVLVHQEFLDVSGDLPARRFAQTLIQALGTAGPIVVYSAFERSRLRELCELVPEYAQQLTAIMGRLLDLLPVVRSGYYHPAMRGSFSIKTVAPAVCPELDYSDLVEVANGAVAQSTWWSLVKDALNPEQGRTLMTGLLAYCKRDTLSMVAVFFAL